MSVGTIVRPADCALAIAFPMNADDFAADLGDPVRHDYASALCRGSSSPEAVRRAFERVCRSLNRLAREAQRLGATVSIGVTRARLVQLMEQHPVVTLVAHWKMAPVVPDDVIDPHALLRAVAGGGSPVLREWRAAIAGSRLDLLADGMLSGEPSALRATVAAVLADIASAAESAYGHTAQKLERKFDASRLRPLARLCLEAQLPPSVFRNAPALELRDGLATAASVIGALPVSYSGLLDMSVCNSTLFGWALKLARPACTTLLCTYLADVEVRGSLYKVTLSELGRRPRPYLEAWAAVRRRAKELAEEIEA